MTQIRNMANSSLDSTVTEPLFSLSPSWSCVLGNELKQPYMQRLWDFLQRQRAEAKVIYPAPAQYFHALNSVDVDRVKVVILGQDPYHGEGQAHGLSFSVPPGVKVPPSLANIYKELHRDLGIGIPTHGCLQSWADQGVLLLNATLSVEQAKAGSHQQRGWERFTDRVIEVLSEQQQGLVFLLWGAYAQKKGQIIDEARHLVLRAPHPSPLSAYRGFIGCGHFSQANRYLQQQGNQPIDWSSLAIEHL